ncbi:hypothetical protein ABH940_007125 [Streptacidiphilus sp. BW17]|uniref:hypothetical protein n=1 Tax=Streptacidiphilus sp. BW17 TaxID=3156274 RepID=UPI0035168C26
MGRFFKDCTLPESRWAKCPHDYTIRYRDAQGQQTEEAGFSNQEKAIARLTEIYREKRELAAKNPGKAERIRKYGAMRFKEHVTEWRAGQRDLSPGSVRSLDSMLSNHLYPALASRRMNTFDFNVVEGFLQTMERGGVSPAAQVSAFNWLTHLSLIAAATLDEALDSPTE